MKDIVEHESAIDLPSRPIPEDVISAVRMACRKPGVRKIVIEKGKPVIVLWRSTEDDTLDFDLESDEDLAKCIQSLGEIREIDAAGRPATECVGQALMELGMSGLCVTHMIVGEKTLLWKWLNYVSTDARGTAPRRLFGCGELLATKSLTDRDFLIVGCATPFGTMNDAVVAYRIVMEPQ